ncbi:hypothetical protein ElyMa_003720700 [Elysia marginata]|uniref:Uncharacterized protein n=1 Tax=Elysia marginata TaxID=1093978 RepID=A0AAV4F4V6_9GAST|nr:hypothetical protein ElyMa_003720700 [Elysia marginata]
MYAKLFISRQYLNIFCRRHTTLSVTSWDQVSAGSTQQESLSLMPRGQVLIGSTQQASLSVMPRDQVSAGGTQQESLGVTNFSAKILPADMLLA